jgi:type VI protein secretion system component VasK
VFDRQDEKFISPPQAQLQEQPATAAPAARGAAPSASAAPGKPMTALQQQAFRKAMAADKTGVKASQSVVNELEKLTDELVGNPEKKIAPHPGLSGITGVQAMLPSLPESLVTSGNSRKAQQRLETLKGKVMAFGRQLASLEGKLGNMAVQEWKFVSDSIQAIDPAAGNLDVQLRDIVRQAKNFANTVQERYDLTYEADGAPAEPTATPPRAGGNAPAAGGLSPAEQAELDQLRKRFRK